MTHIYRVIFYYDDSGLKDKYRRQSVYLVQSKSTGDAAVSCGKDFKTYHPEIDVIETRVTRIEPLNTLDDPVTIYDYGPFGINTPAGF